MPSENARMIYENLTSRGLPAHVAAGLVGNIMQESGPNINTRAVGDNGNAFGMAQWNGPRRRQFFEFAATQDRPPTDLQTQIDFLVNEFQTTEKGAFDQIMAAPDAASAALVASDKFWRPGVPHNERRRAYAEQIMAQFGGGQDAPSFSREQLIQEAQRRGLNVGGQASQSFSREQLVQEARRRGLPVGGKAASPAQQSEPQGEPQSLLSGAMDAFTQGASFGFGDELTAAEAAILGRTPSGGWFDYSKPLIERYQEALGAERGQQAEFEAKNPEVAIPAEIAGAVATGVGAARAGATLAGRAATTRGAIAAGAGEGAIYGGLYGAGEAEGNENIAPEAIGSAATGAVIGGAVGGLVDRFVRNMTAAQARKAAPTTRQLKQEADRLYMQARAINPTMPRFDDFVSQIRPILDDQGFLPALHPRLETAIKEFEKAAATRGVTFKDVEKLRRVAKGATGNITNQDEGRLAGILIDGLDNYVETFGPISPIRTARQLYGRFKRSDLVDDAIERARRRAASTGSGGNVENAIRQNIRAILDSPRKRRGFTAEEIEAMEKVVRGTPVQNAFRLVGKLSPSGNGLMAALGLGATVANPAMVAFPMVGMFAKAAADRGTQTAAQTASATIRAGAAPVGVGASAGQRAIGSAGSGYIGARNPLFIEQ